MGMLLTYREGYFPGKNDPERAKVEHAGERKPRQRKAPKPAAPKAEKADDKGE